ncbi:inositol hexakisphosphate kinase 1-like isoform X2 [Periplaneta americana]
MLSLDQATVCKPLVPRELQFYETIPEAVRKFTPKFYGVIQVSVVQEEGGYVTLIATPPDCYKPMQSVDKSHRIRMRRSGSIEVDSNVEGLFHEDQPEEGASGASSSSKEVKKETALNPWVLKCHRTQLQELMASIHADNSVPNFILLENLTWKFTFPCILDLKMGTRQYGDAASLPKKQSKMFKVVSTTSGKLGVRIGGMQVYQVTTQRFLCRNKFYGRSLSVGGFQQALRQFLHNGAKLRSDVLPPLIRRLEELVYILGRQDAVRFYTTSLLLLYEGDDCHSGTSGTVYDFDKARAKSLEKESRISFSRDHNADSLRNEFKVGHLHRRSSSVETLSGVFDKSLDDLIAASDDSCKSPPGSHHRRSSSTATFEDIKLNSSSSFEASVPSSPLPSPEPLVDVRIIDFAHSTHKGLDDPVVYSGPDRGFLFGLENMIALLKGIERDHG